MNTVELQLTLHDNEDGSYSVRFMGKDVISFSKSVYETDGDKIYEALVNMFAKGFELGVKAEQNGLTKASISEK